MTNTHDAGEHLPGGLLATKTAIPPLRPNVVVRPRLAAVLDSGLSRRLTLLTAPAGYGKTTLLSAWANTCKSPIAWVSLEPADSSVEHFLKYLITALKQHIPGIGASTLAMLQSRTRPSIEQLSTPIVNELAAAGGELAIVLDDYHFIDLQEVHQTVDFVLNHMPATTHLLISSRSDPPLPLASLRAAGDLIEIRAEHLQFSAEEASAFLRKTLSIELSQESVERLSAQVEGWAAGIQLAALAMQGRDDPEAFVDEFSGSHRYVVDFLTEQVLQVQSESIRDFLLQTSILETLTAGLCQAVTGQPESQQILSDLERSNLFIFPLDDQREWFRYHHLFRDALFFRLTAQATDESTRELHQRAANWYVGNEFVQNALLHWVQAEDYTSAADLIEAVGIQMLAGAQLERMKRWIDLLPSEVVKARPMLSIIYGWILNLTGRLEEMNHYLQDAEAAIPDGNSQLANKLTGMIANIRAGAARKQNDPTSAIEYLQQALDYLPKEDSMLRSSAQFNLGSSLLDLGKANEARRELRKSIEGAKIANSRYTFITGASYLADCFVLQGRLGKAVRIYEQAIHDGAAAEHEQPLSLAGFAHGGLGKVLYEQGKLDEAETHLELAMELSEKLADWTIMRRALPTLARLQQLSGRLAESDASWERAFNLAEQYGDRPGIAYLNAFRALLHLERAAMKQDSAGLAEASQWADRYRARNADPEDYRETVAQIALSWTEVLDGSTAQAEKRLTQVAASAEMSGRIDCLIKVQACMALAQWERMQVDAALATLDQVFAHAQPEGYCRAFLDYGPTMVEVLGLASEKATDSTYPARLLESAANDPRAQPKHTLPDPLTVREMEVLHLLAAGYSNQQIADKLVLALGTVKQYNHIIFRKLDVRSRSEAAARARALRLL